MVDTFRCACTSSTDDDIAKEPNGNEKCLEVSDVTIVEVDRNTEQVQNLNKDEVFHPMNGEFWLVRHGKEKLYALVDNMGHQEDKDDQNGEDDAVDEITVKFFQKKNNYHIIDDTKFTITKDDFISRVAEPSLLPIGKSRVYYLFNERDHFYTNILLKIFVEDFVEDFYPA